VKQIKARLEPLSLVLLSKLKDYWKNLHRALEGRKNHWCKGLQYVDVTGFNRPHTGQGEIA
jgi:hypothetical protein